MADLPSKVDPVEYPATYNCKAFDVRLTVRYNESHFSKIFDHQRQFYSSRIQMSIEGVEVDLLTEIPEWYDEKGVPNTLTFQQYMLSGVSLATLNAIS